MSGRQTPEHHLGFQAYCCKHYPMTYLVSMESLDLTAGLKICITQTANNKLSKTNFNHCLLKIILNRCEQGKFSSILYGQWQLDCLDQIHI
jgi:hypothetical protein